MTERVRRNFGLGALCGTASAILFGLSAPVAKLLLPGASPWLLAGLLYLGAGLGLSLIRLAVSRPEERPNAEPIQRRRHA